MIEKLCRRAKSSICLWFMCCIHAHRLLCIARTQALYGNWINVNHMSCHCTTYEGMRFQRISFVQFVWLIPVHTTTKQVANKLFISLSMTMIATKFKIFNLIIYLSCDKWIRWQYDIIADIFTFDLMKYKPLNWRRRCRTLILIKWREFRIQNTSQNELSRCNVTAPDWNVNKNRNRRHWSINGYLSAETNCCRQSTLHTSMYLYGLHVPFEVNDINNTHRRRSQKVTSESINLSKSIRCSTFNALCRLTK